MNLVIRKADDFMGDFDRQFRWYVVKAGWKIAERYLAAVDETLERLAEHPELGRLRRFRRLELAGLRSWTVERPFSRHLVFYRHNEATLEAVRVLPGSRDLPRRLLQPPGAADE